ncbi:MAG: hypothetical protein R3F35_01690 [Myxococcota bacterium]
MSESAEHETLDADDERRSLSLMTPLGHPEEARSAALLRARAYKRLGIALEMTFVPESNPGSANDCMSNLIHDARTLLEAADAIEAGDEIEFDCDCGVMGAETVSGVLATCNGDFRDVDVAELALGAVVSARDTLDHYRAAVRSNKSSPNAKE